MALDEIMHPRHAALTHSRHTRPAQGILWRVDMLSILSFSQAVAVGAPYLREVPPKDTPVPDIPQLPYPATRHSPLAVYPCHAPLSSPSHSRHVTLNMPPPYWVRRFAVASFILSPQDQVNSVATPPSPSRLTLPLDCEAKSSPPLAALPEACASPVHCRLEDLIPSSGAKTRLDPAPSHRTKMPGGLWLCIT